MSKSVKIAYIGGGSKCWARQFLTDLALCEHLRGEIALYDIDAVGAERNRDFARDLFRHPDARTTFEISVWDRIDAALGGADFVLISIEPGPVECRYADLLIPEKFGIHQTVGDTTGPGGIVRAMRCWPDYAVFAEAIRTHCPQAWVINYTNPMTLCTAFLYRVFPEIKAFGCCHEVFDTQKKLAELAETSLGIPRPHHKEIELDLAGVNHFTFVSGARWRGRDLFPLLLQRIQAPDCFADETAFALENIAAQRVFTSKGLVALDLLRRTGCLGAAGDRHLVEFVPYYLGSWETLHRFGVVQTSYELRLDLDRTKAPVPPVKHDTPLATSGEEGVALLCALAGAGDLVTNLNFPNRGQVGFLPPDAVVETFATVSADHVEPVNGSMLTGPARALVQRVAQAQALALEAIAAQDKDAILQALMVDPLVTISADQAARMLNEMLGHLRARGLIVSSEYHEAP